ncbi:glycerophosphodiester phosphodiesterase family protein [Pararhodobacter oceanensis]|uniref:Phosphodiesterase n=1 Tax=Pararhodobacter oceanensis TaxID=2172121 RepID=A0A2T8HV41_9RHOB|nr:glycerophosphodiester phosphodiesterase family protein [Pararhodobacter oceanensis]PVH29256.1 phosphodiesterase [Pararhodobacter oceanensis]
MLPTLHETFLTRPLAHRALHDASAGRPENSLAAVRHAVALGYGIEIDLQPSADGQAMVFHDYDLGRLTHATGQVKALDAAQLQALQVRGGDAPIPTLPEVLAEVAGQVPLLIELKDQSRALGHAQSVLESATAQALQGYDGPVALMSFNPKMIGNLAQMAPHVPRGLTTYAFPERDVPPDTPPEMQVHRETLAQIAAYDAVGACFISHDWHDLNRPRVAELKAQGAAILSWTIRTPAEEMIARQIAQNITFESYLPERP